MALAIGVFAAVLIAIASERVDRTKTALAGAVVLVLLQTIEQHAAIEAIDWNTLGLLAGMMLMVQLDRADRRSTTARDQGRAGLGRARRSRSSSRLPAPPRSCRRSSTT